MTIVEIPRAVTGGVDTHLDTNVAAALDDVGGLLGVEEFATDAAGHRRLLAWLETFGDVSCVGVEGTGSYGVGLARSLRAAGIRVVEVESCVHPGASFAVKVSHASTTRPRLNGGPRR